MFNRRFGNKPAIFYLRREIEPREGSTAHRAVERGGRSPTNEDMRAAHGFSTPLGSAIGTLDGPL